MQSTNVFLNMLSEIPFLPQIQIDGNKMKLVFLKNKKNWVVFLNFYLFGI